MVFVALTIMIVAGTQSVQLSRKGFFDFGLRKGSDLITPSPRNSFPGLKPIDRWCLCAQRWQEAFFAGCAPKVDLQATDIKALDSTTYLSKLVDKMPVRL